MRVAAVLSLLSKAVEKAVALIMQYNDIIGTIGVGLILVAYALSLFSLIAKEGKLFFVLNIIGSALACYASVLIEYVPFIVLEGVWCIVSVIGFYKLLTKNR
nr:hypothetical protein [Cylindrospermopsis raciborskii]